MNPDELQRILDDLLQLPNETEWVEFKEAKDNFDFEILGKYFSALSNEANLKGRPYGWLVFGVQDHPRAITGTNFRRGRPDLDRLKHDISTHTTSRLTFEEIHELTIPDGRVILFQIPPALRGIPISWKGHFYGRNGESLVPLTLREIEQIRGQGVGDWSARICERATLDDLDPAAILFAREQFLKKHSWLSTEMNSWDDRTFLNKSKVCIEGRITTTAILLLGREESVHHLSPAIGQITWTLQGEHGIPRDYEHFGPPFLLNVDQVYSKIRNLTYRYLRDAHLFPTEVGKYDPWVVREALHNCIAHQDYSLRGRINVVEEEDSLLFTNVGHFLPESVDRAIQLDAPLEVQRNPFLTRAMVELNMIDTVGSGIKRMFVTQKSRSFPLPDYDLSNPERVQLRVIGKILDENYTRVLMTQTDLNLFEVIALDKVQKGRPLDDIEIVSLRKKGLIEGRRPHFFVSARIAAVTGEKSKYIKLRAFDNQHYKNMILSFLVKFQHARRSDFYELLLDKLSDTLDERQKRRKVGNLLQEMASRDGTIRRSGGSTKAAHWILTEKGLEISSKKLNR